MNLGFQLRKNDFKKIVDIIKRSIDEYLEGSLPEGLSLNYLSTEDEHLKELNEFSIFYKISRVEEKFNSFVIGFRVSEEDNNIIINAFKGEDNYSDNRFSTRTRSDSNNREVRKFKGLEISIDDLLNDDGEVKVTGKIKEALESYLEKLARDIAKSDSLFDKQKDIQMKHLGDRSSASSKISNIFNSDDFKMAVKKSVKDIKEKPYLEDIILNYAKNNRSLSAPFYKNTYDFLLWYEDKDILDFNGKSSRNNIKIFKDLIDIIYMNMPEGSEKLSLKDLFLSKRMVQSPVKKSFNSSVFDENIKISMFNKLIEDTEEDEQQDFSSEADDSWIKVDETFQELMDKYMDSESPCSTLIGEIVAAANKLIYRYYNDGDIPGIGYGNETCNQPLEYLMANGVLQTEFNNSCKLIEYIVDNEDCYEQEIIRCLQDWVIDWWNDNIDICEKPVEDGGWLEADIGELSVCDDCGYREWDAFFHQWSGDTQLCDDCYKAREEEEEEFEESVKSSKKCIHESKVKKIKENYSCKDYVVVVPYSDEAYNYLIDEFADTYMITYDGEEAFLIQISDLRKFFEECDLEDDGVEVYEAPEDAEYLEDLSEISLENLDRIYDGYSAAFECDDL